MNVVEHFLSLQGEGRDVGVPAYFFRLAGCDVHCPWCDTKESWNKENGEEISLASAVNLINELTPSSGICVITGGEPFLHGQELAELLYSVNDKIKIRIETSASCEDYIGHNHYSLPKNVSLNISPKEAKPAIADYWVHNKVNEFRFAVDKKGEQNISWLSKFLSVYKTSMLKATKRIYVSPVIHGNINNPENKDWINEVADFCMSNGLRFSLQMHKVLGIK